MDLYLNRPLLWISWNGSFEIGFLASIKFLLLGFPDGKPNAFDFQASNPVDCLVVRSFEPVVPGKQSKLVDALSLKLDEHFEIAPLSETPFLPERHWRLR